MTSSSIFIPLLMLIGHLPWGHPYFGNVKMPQFTPKQPFLDGGCFCMLRGNVDDCTCKIETIDSFNSKFVIPKMSGILAKSYFRYFKVNMHRDCPFWTDDGRCILRDCAVEECPENDLPVGLKGKISSESGAKQYPQSSRKYQDPINMGSPSCNEERNMSAVDVSLTAENKKTFKTWKRHDDKRENFCELEDEDSETLQYVDLLKNPERFTGYSGPSAHRVWNSIYQENCFKEDVTSYQQLLTQGAPRSPDEGLCLEKRAFYRVVSGLHTSINVHLCAEYLLKGSPFDKTNSIWGPNVAEFHRRFDPNSTNGKGPQWLRNLYFLYLLELRALSKAAPYLIEREKYFTGNKTEDESVQRDIADLMGDIQSFEGHFDESSMFSNKEEGLLLKEEFKTKFRNISRIMDCVGCDKCKLWGKIQITGIGTALKILFPPDNLQPKNFYDTFGLPSSLQLQRSEVVALFNAFGRVSGSIQYVHMFKDLLNTNPG